MVVAQQESQSHSIFVKEYNYNSTAPSTSMSSVNSESMEMSVSYRSTTWPYPTPLSSETHREKSAASPALQVHVSCRDEPPRSPTRTPLMDIKLDFNRSPLFDPKSSLGHLHSCLSPPPCTFVGGSPSFLDELTQSGSTRRLLRPVDVGDVAEFVGEDDDGRLGWKEEEELHGRVEPAEAMGSASPRLYLSAEPGLLPHIKFALETNGRNLHGKITVEEIEQAIISSALMNKITLSREEAEECAQLITEELAAEPHRPDRGISSDTSSPHADLSQQRPPASTLGRGGGRAMSRVGLFFRTNWRRIWVVVLWLTACLALFAWKFMQYRRRLAFEVMGYCLCTAKGAAETLKLNMALVLLPVCRNTMTWLQRSRRINSVVPFNDTINFHKLVAGGIVIGVILHGGTHLTCDFPRIANADRAVFQRTIAHCFGYRQPSYLQIVLTTEGGTGIAMVVLMVVAFLLATRRPRRRPSSLPRPMNRWAGFNAFWYAHHLLIVVYVLLVIHSMFLFLTNDVYQKTTWMYLAIPVLMYAGERLVRSIRSEIYDVEILKATVYPGKVVSLKLMKPAGFKFRSGMHIYVQCPQISRFEWHPFSLTSAPDDDYLGLHIRSLGDWSCQLYSIFQEALVSGNPELPKIAIDGPYGAASQGHAKYKIILLVGLGIGATPFISILKDIANALRRPPPEETTVGGDLNGNGDGDGDGDGGIEKAYFYWVTREQGSFEWFREIMKEVSAMNKKQGVIEMHNYLTSVFEEGDKRSALVSAVQALHLMKSGVDIISKTPVRTNFARPNWARVLSGLASRHGGRRIGVFYCGPASLGRELQRLCNEMTIKTSTRFVFHKENY